MSSRDNNGGAPSGYIASGITKSYTSVQILKGVDVHINPGEVVGLIGHNGAGKSTLLKCLSGAHRPDGGTLSIDGTTVEFSSPADALSAGVATVYQELSLLTNLTVTENIFLAQELTGRLGLDRATMRHQAQQLVDRFAIPVDVDAKVGDYPVALRQLLEIAIATTKNIKYLLLDEPTTSLEGDQVDRLIDYLKELTAQGIGILIIDHKLDELYKVADRIVAIVDGQIALDGRVDDLTHADVVAAIVGEAEDSGSTPAAADGTDSRRAPSANTGPVTLQAHHVAAEGCAGVNLVARRGEVLGLYGLVGAGRTEFLRALIGVNPLLSGTITLNGEPYHPKNPADAGRKGIVYVTEERKSDGIVPLMNGLDNVGLPVLSNFARAGWINRSQLESRSTDILNSLSIRGDIHAPVESLSGGNQQKVLLARAIAQQPQVLLLDEPTKGVDIGVKSQIHDLLKKMARDTDITLIVASSEEEEILSIADRVVVFAQGATITESLDVGDLTVGKLRELAWSH